MPFCHLLILFQNQLPFSKISFRNTVRVSNSLDADQDQQNVVPVLEPNLF